MIKIKNANDNDYKWISSIIDKDEDINELFENRTDRLISSFGCYIIYLGNTKIGFMSLVDEGVPGYSFLDSAIIQKYRGHGYGKKALEILLSATRKWPYVVIAETKKDNIQAIKSLDTPNTELLDETDEALFFVLEYDKFINKSAQEQNLIFNHIDSKKIR